MSPDEIFALIGSLIISLFTWGLWWWLKIQLKRFAATSSLENVKLVVSLMLSAGLLFALLANFASHDVRDSVIYMFFYMVMGAAIVGLGVVFLGWLGLNLRDDVIERRNPIVAQAKRAKPGSPLQRSGYSWSHRSASGKRLGRLYARL